MVDCPFEEGVGDGDGDGDLPRLLEGKLKGLCGLAFPCLVLPESDEHICGAANIKMTSHHF